MLPSRLCNRTKPPKYRKVKREGKIFPKENVKYFHALPHEMIKTESSRNEIFIKLNKSWKGAKYISNVLLHSQHYPSLALLMYPRHFSLISMNKKEHFAVLLVIAFWVCSKNRFTSLKSNVRSQTNQNLDQVQRRRQSSWTQKTMGIE